MDELFKALSDGNRRQILEVLKERDMTVSELNQHFPISMASLSHHLAILKQVNLVIAQREGKYIYYSLNTSVFEEVVKMLISIFENQEEK